MSVRRFESFISGPDKSNLFVQNWLIPSPKGELLVTHGLAEHSECYNAFAHRLNQEGWNVWAWDLPGHGKSSGKRGYVQDFQQYIDDLSRVLSHVKKQADERSTPIYLFGHSMGGLITFLFSAKTQTPQFKGVILSSPAFGLSLEVPKIKSQAAKMLLKWAPRVTLYNEVDHSKLTRDESLVRAYALDHLRHDKISAPVFLGMLDGFKQVDELANQFHHPVLMIVGGQDQITDSTTTEQIFKKIPGNSKQLFISPNSYHEVFNDLDKEDAFQCLIKYLNPPS